MTDSPESSSEDVVGKVETDAEPHVDDHLLAERGVATFVAVIDHRGIVIDLKLTSSSFYALPESWPSTGYPGPLEYVFNAINS